MKQIKINLYSLIIWQDLNPTRKHKLDCNSKNQLYDQHFRVKKKNQLLIFTDTSLKLYNNLLKALLVITFP